MTDQPARVLPTKMQDLCGFSVDFDHVTKLVEKGSTAALENILPCRQPGVEAQDILKTIQTINEQHIKEHPNDKLPKLTFSQESDWPSSWGTNNILKMTREGKDDRYIYVQTNYSDGTRTVREHHPDFFKKNEK